MILDSIENINKYSSLHPALGEAVKFVMDNGDSIPEGRYKLDGDKLFVTIVEAALKPAQEASIEAHRKYVDVQIVLNGTESYGWAAVEKCTMPRSEFDTRNDIIFYSDAPTEMFTIQRGQFVIFYPSDGHAPLIGSGNVRKAIIKVEI